MIRLKTLKIGDIIYEIHKYYWIQKLEVTREIHEFEYQNTEVPTIYCASARIISDSKVNHGSNQTIFEKDERNIFRSLEEAQKAVEGHKQRKLAELAKGNNLVESLYEMAYQYMSQADQKLYREAIDNGSI